MKVDQRRKGDVEIGECVISAGHSKRRTSEGYGTLVDRMCGSDGFLVFYVNLLECQFFRRNTDHRTCRFSRDGEGNTPLLMRRIMPKVDPIDVVYVVN